MSGGYFDYKQHIMEDAVAAIDRLVATNDDDSLDEYGDIVGRLPCEETK